MSDKLTPKADGKSQKELLSTTISRPSPTDNGSVKVLSLFAPTGQLCRANGVASPPPDYGVKAVYIYNSLNPGGPDPSVATIKSGTKKEYAPVANTNQAWSVASTDNILAAAASAPASSNNKLWVLSSYMNPSNGNTQDDLVAVPSAYKGISTLNCPAFSLEEEEEASRKDCQQIVTSRGPSIVHGHRDCGASCASGCQCCHSVHVSYHGLSVSNPNGNWLHLDNSPLRASVIAVTARNVFWKPIPNSTLVIRHPSGNVVDFRNFESDELRFPGLPPYSIVVYQPGTGIAQALNAACLHHPELVWLDPNHDVLVYVNDRTYYDNNGSFSLSVAM